MVDRRRRHPFLVIVTKLYMAESNRRWRGMKVLSGSTLNTADRPLQDRLYERYEKGLHVPRDRPGGFIDRMEEVVPGSAAFFRSPAWAILIDRPPTAAALRTYMARGGIDRLTAASCLRTFSELEALLIHVELARAESDHGALIGAVAGLATALPSVRFVPEVALELDAVMATLQERLRVWRMDADKRRVLDSSELPCVPKPLACHDRGAIKSRPGSESRVARLSNLLASLTFLALASLATNPFSIAALMLMVGVHALLTTTADVGHFVRASHNLGGA